MSGRVIVITSGKGGLLAKLQLTLTSELPLQELVKRSL